MKNKLTVILLALFTLATGCSKNDDLQYSDDDNDGKGEDTMTVPTIPSIVDPDNEEDFVENQTFSAAVRITFSGSSATVNNSVAGVSVAQSGAGITITSSTQGVEYVLSGTTTNGYLKIYSDYKFKLQLEGVSITNASGPAINVQSGKRCYVVLTDGTASNLTDGSAYASSNEDQKGCFFSEGELIFSGKGSVNIKGNYKHGICSDDYVRIREGSITVASTTDAIHTNDAFIMDDGVLTATGSSDGIECESGYIYVLGGTLTVNSSDDGIVTSFAGTDTSINPAIVITGGDITINTTAQKGIGLKSSGDISVAAGTVNIKTTGAAAKGIKADGSVVLSGTSDITVTTSGNAFVESGDTSSAAGVKTGKHFGMTGGTLTVKSSGLGGKGINTDGSIVIDDGYLSITTTGSSFSSGGLYSRPKGIKSGASFTIHGGTCIVSATHEGIEATNNLTFNGGRVEVKATDDAINVPTSNTGSIVFNGGSVYAYSSGNDAVDSNGSIVINGGTIIADGTSSPEEAFDCDNNTIKINGGIVIGTGGKNQTLPSSAGGQRSIAYAGSASSGQYVALKNSTGENIIVYRMGRTLSEMKMILSHPALANGTYTITKDGTYSGGTEVFKGYYTGGTYSGGTSTSFNISTMYTAVGSVSGGGGGGKP